MAKPSRLASLRQRTPQLRISGISAPAALAGPNAKRVMFASSIAVAATGVAVSTGVAGSATGAAQLAADSTQSMTLKAGAANILKDRSAPVVTRSLDRQGLARTVKAAALSSATGAAVTQTADLTLADPKSLTMALMPSFGMSPSDFSCIDAIWTQESGWNIHADNPSSGAYGIPQALPGSKMASAGPDWQNNAETQIRWGLGYIKSRYGTPCNASAFKFSHGWY